MADDHKVGPVITQPFTNHEIMGETFANRPIFHYMAIDGANVAHLAELDPKSAFVCRPSYDYWASIGPILANKAIVAPRKALHVVLRANRAF
jgi:hypothetical protein